MVRPFAGDEGWRRVTEGPSPPSDENLPPPATEVGQDLAPFLQALLDSAHRQEDLLEAILTELREQAQRGLIYGPAALNVPTGTPVELTFDPPLFAISITNDGAGAVQYRLPNRAEADWVNLLPTEVDNFSFIKAVVESIAFRVAGAAASVRVKGTK